MRAPGLVPIMPDGAMYMMIRIDFSRFPQFVEDLQFVQALVSKKSVFCLPGSCFGFPGFIRVVLTVPKDKIPEACNRIVDFCNAENKTKLQAMARRTSEFLL